MTREALYAFIRRHRWAVVASVNESGLPQAAVVGIVVTPKLELIFDTIGTTRKSRNLRRTGRIAMVIGWDQAITVQLDGVADEPAGAELAECKALYLAQFPDGVERESWPDITYFRIRPEWVRYSDFNPSPAQISEVRFDR